MTMKTNLLSLLSGVALLFGTAACHDPEVAPIQHFDENITSLTATFYDDDRIENSFPAEIDHENGIIKVVFPYTYPALSESHLEAGDITHVRVQCNLVTGARMEPALTWLDLSKDHNVTVIGNDGTKKAYTITSEIRKSNLCVITDFQIPAYELSGIINQETGTISVITGDDLGMQNATLIMSHGATVSPDPRTTAINFDEDVKLTVTAQNGVDKKEYTVVKGAPQAIAAGGNFAAAEIIWVKKLADYGIPVATGATDAPAGLAVVGNHVVINKVNNPNAVYVNIKTGQQEGTVDLSAVGNSGNGVLANHRMTSDKSGNILVCNSSKNDGGKFNIWRKKGIDGALENYISCTYGGNQMGNQLSVVGSLDGDAIITATGNGSSLDFYRWVVKGGQLQSQEPELVHITGYDGACWGNADVIYTDPSNPSSDYVSAAYCKFAETPTENRGAALVDGVTNTIKSHGSLVVSSNWVINAADCVEFNKVKYIVHNSINTFTWGSDDNLYLYDFSGNLLDTKALDFTEAGINLKGQYGSMATSGVAGLAGNAGDVTMSVSSTGFYLYILFEFANGYVGCVQVDCMAPNN